MECIHVLYTLNSIRPYTRILSILSIIESLIKEVFFIFIDEKCQANVLFILQRMRMWHIVNIPSRHDCLQNGCRISCGYTLNICRFYTIIKCIYVCKFIDTACRWSCCAANCIVYAKHFRSKTRWLL